MPEDGEQRDKQPTRVGQPAQRRPQQVRRDAGLCLKPLDERRGIGSAGPGRAERQPDEHRVAVRPVDQAPGQPRGQLVACQPLHQHARLAAVEAAKRERLEPGELGIFPADGQEPGAGRGRQVLNHRPGQPLAAEQLGVVQADQRLTAVERGGQQVQPLIRREGPLRLARLKQGRRLWPAVPVKEPGQPADDRLHGRGDALGEGQPAHRHAVRQFPGDGGGERRLADPGRAAHQHPAHLGQPAAQPGGRGRPRDARPRRGRYGSEIVSMGRGAVRSPTVVRRARAAPLAGAPRGQGKRVEPAGQLRLA